MGNPISKSIDEAKEDSSDSNASNPTTPVSRPKFSKDLNELDPRSPSANIIRTPIQDVVSDMNSTINYEIIGTPTTTKILSFDPRSPNSEFVRTPIVVNREPGEVKIASMKLHNKNLDNVRKSIIQCATPPPKESASTPERGIIPPKFLGSSPVVVKSNDNKRRSFAGLLETNLDYVETDLDAVLLKTGIQNISTSSRKPATPIKELKENFLNSTNSPKSPVINICEKANVDPRSPTLEFLRTPIQVMKKIGEIELNDVNDEARSYVDETINHKDNAHIKEESRGIHQQNEEVLDNPKPKVIEVKEKSALKQDTKIVKNVKEFDKKLSNLIYEDVDVNTPQKIQKPKDENRTPLGNRNVNGAIKKSAIKLKVSDKPTKSVLGHSKIPILKDKFINGKLEPCENTPPRSANIRNEIVKKSNWDADSTLII